MPRIGWLTVGFIFGVAAGLAHPGAAPAGAAVVLSAVAMAWIQRRRPAEFLGWLVVASVGIGATCCDVRHHRVDATDVRTLARREPTLVGLRGVLMDRPRLITPRGPWAQYDPRPRHATFRLRVTARRDDLGWHPAGGVVRVRVDETLPPLGVGTSVAITGWLTAPRSPGNPGSRDGRLAMARRGEAGWLSVPRRSLVEVPTQPPATGAGAARAWWRSRVEAWLWADSPVENDSVRDALAAALLLGSRREALSLIEPSVRRAGLGHVLALSGLHVGVLVGGLLLLLRAAGRGVVTQGLFVLAALGAYLLLVEPRVSVLRAGLMATIAMLGLIGGRRHLADGMISISTVVILTWRPAELLSPGFQLSYLVVLALVHLSSGVRRRLFGEPDPHVSSLATLVDQRGRDLLAAGITAGLVATPLSAYHWQVIWPYAPLAGLVALPLVSIVLTTGMLKIALSAILPSAGLLLAIPVAVALDILVAIVRGFSALPGAAVMVPKPSGWWVALALAWVTVVCARSGSGRRGRRRALVAAGLALLTWWWVPTSTWRSGLRIDVLDVGHGSCWLLRSGASAVLFDAGSTDLSAGSRRVVPALRALGVRRLDAIIISHANLDHYSAVPDVLDMLPVERVLVGPQLLDRAAESPNGPLGVLLDTIVSANVPIERVTRGERRRYGVSRWRWLHPTSERAESTNDESMVIRVEAAGRTVVLCGDVERETIAAVRALYGDGEVDVMEIPHHGRYTFEAAEWVAAVDPHVVICSSGWSRWDRQRDAWSATPRRKWLVTPRDGAVWVEIDHDGVLATGGFRRLR